MFTHTLKKMMDTKFATITNPVCKNHASEVRASAAVCYQQMYAAKMYAATVPRETLCRRGGGYQLTTMNAKSCSLARGLTFERYSVKMPYSRRGLSTSSSSAGAGAGGPPLRCTASATVSLACGAQPQGPLATHYSPRAPLATCYPLHKSISH
jgi:hypothetical protein